MHTSIKERLEHYFLLEKKKDEEILNQIILFIYYLESSSSQSDLFILGRLLPHDQLYKLIAYYDGDILKMPSKDEFKKSYILAVSFYLKEIKNWNWEDIKKILPDAQQYEEFTSSISLGKKIGQIKEKMNKELYKLLKDLNIADLKKFNQEIFYEQGSRNKNKRNR
jgi:hypothetical protein